MLSPRHSRELSFTGEIRIKRHHVVEFTLANGLRLTFNDHYRYVDGDNRETISFPELTGEFESEANIDDVNSWLETLDDFLLIVSFAARERCACVGWTAHDAKQMVKLFRRNVVIPRKEGRQSMHDGLIEASDFEEFIKTAYGQFIGLERKELIRQALYRVLPKENGTLESSYLSLYSALETLVLFSNQNSGGDLILDESEWKQFNGDAREFIRKHPLFAQSTAKRKLVYEKLPELNRISFKSAFDAFCRRFNIELSDLWPVVGREGGATLARIRNKLIHGDSFDPIQGHAFMSAREHLTWIVERSLMSILGWDFTRSKTSKTYLPHMTMYNEWHNDRKVLSGL
jgi:hypothetical protein